VRAKSLGLTLDEIKDILALKDGQALTYQAVYDRLSKKVQEIEENIRQLQALQNELMPLVKRCQKNLQTSDQECVVLDGSPTNSPKA
jgi:DNA-binding transcriptional MerR regulator